MNSLNLVRRVPPLFETLLQFLAFIFVACLVSFFLIAVIQDSNIVFAHTAVELIAIFFALSGFMITWFLFDRASPKIHMIGFAFLAVAVFNLSHTLAGIDFFQHISGEYDLANRFRLVVRIVEAIVLLLFSLDITFRSDFIFLS
ncbi:MASE3 domain-containing protein [Heliorestis acidaminivorans]|uniref:MASE3 domain-containing protein n=1 Tax=Heliorestis acidaminivorans TaxID=553427 RepID=UPI00147839ED|nr:MASE3 domain-containing protein [Heliorestis acidaminivorans]